MQTGETECKTLTTREVAVILGVSEHLVGRMAARGEIPGAFRAGRLWRYSEFRLYTELLGHDAPPAKTTEGGTT